MENKINQNSNADYKECGDTCACRPSDEKCVDPRSRKPLPFMQGELADTAAGMTSPDYKERFRAEYIQTKIRYERLKAFNTKIEAAYRTECERPEVKKAQHRCLLTTALTTSSANSRKSWVTTSTFWRSERLSRE